MKVVFVVTNMLLLSLVSGGIEPLLHPRRMLSGSNADSWKENGFSSVELIPILLASFIFVVIIDLIVVCFYMWKLGRDSAIPSQPRYETERLVLFKEVGVPLIFDTLVIATSNFSSRFCIGSGRFGSTYRAEISMWKTVAVKQLTVEMCEGVSQFDSEIGRLGRIQHPNLVGLIGHYISSFEPCLVYEYIPGGNLEEFIQLKRNRFTSLKIVTKIATDVAIALAFLHDECYPRVLHRDVKPSNILLDNDLNAYVSDFGLSRLLDRFETHVQTGVFGSFGYMAPEYALTCRASDKEDVYSFGVILLELISDKRAFDPSFLTQANSYTIVSWAVMLYQEGRLKEFFAAYMWEAGPETVLLDLLQLGLICTSDSVNNRPNMSQVVKKLKQAQFALDC